MQLLAAFRSFSKIAFGFFLTFTLTGCVSLPYLLQAGKGQWELSNRAKPISDVLKDERTPPRIRKLLAEINPIKKFAETVGIKPTTNYTEYVKLDRPAAVWVVSAAEKLRFKSKEWNFLVVGSFPYLGWFDLEAGRKYRDQLASEGWDADLRGARAFSTLGWFKDAVLSTMIPDGDDALGDLVNVVIHESTHATIYVKGQAYFDESLANFVADHLTPIYLEKTRGKESPELVSYLKNEKENESREAAMHEAYRKLNELYASNRPDVEKLSEKSKILTELKNRFQFKREINNATLIQFKEYNVGRPEFEALYGACKGDWHRFLGVLSRVGSDSFVRAQQDDLAPVLVPLAEKGCI